MKNRVGGGHENSMILWGQETVSGERSTEGRGGGKILLQNIEISDIEKERLSELN